MATPAYWPKGPLAYVEWFTKPKLTPRAASIHNMPSVSKDIRNGKPLYSIVPLGNVRQSCMLIPDFDKTPPSVWDTDEPILDTCTHFHVNNWQSLYAYQTIYM